MHKKVLIGLVLSIFLIFSFTVCYAEDKNKNEMGKNMMNTAQNTVQDAGKEARNMIKGAANSIKDGAKNVGNAIVGGASAAGKAVENGINNVKDTMENKTENTMDENAMNDNNAYTATRTADENTFMGMTSNTWSWLILGIAAIAIIALVWYYSMQLNNGKRNDKDE